MMARTFTVASSPPCSTPPAPRRPGRTTTSKRAPAATVSMTVQYVGATKRSDLVCHGRTVRRRKELVFTEITATDSDGTVVAHAVQTYRIA
jgi:acyl-coenzyme A thioesterase PaaI-like protein